MGASFGATAPGLPVKLASACAVALVWWRQARGCAGMPTRGSSGNEAICPMNELAISADQKVTCQLRRTGRPNRTTRPSAGPKHVTRATVSRKANMTAVAVHASIEADHDGAL